MSENKSIAIVGAGLVGSLLSVFLAKRGFTVDVYEHRMDMRNAEIIAGRSINLALSDRGWKALETVGLDKQIRDIAIPMKGRMIHDEKGGLSLLPYGQKDQAIYSVSRAELNITMMNYAETFENVSYHFEMKCSKVDIAATEIYFGEIDEVPAESKEFEYIFGADGAFSAIRESMHFQDQFNLSQKFLKHGYKELTIPPKESDDKNDKWLLEKNALHIWPRKQFMLIALPNIDGSFTCTLFFAFEGTPSFDAIKDEDDLEKFFKTEFPDAYDLMPTLKSDFFTNATSSLVTIQCDPWVNNNTVLIGDAAHA
ncbi:MAG: FAD-dependent monooxygenase, partial [Bacteroidetes bacterium]|nr:FAD-dependent monooxygenase [Bacteroidota bacterium]